MENNILQATLLSENKNIIKVDAPPLTLKKN